MVQNGAVITWYIMEKTIPGFNFRCNSIRENDLAIQVTNLWVNRLIGDAQPNTTEKITYTTMPFYRANSPLLTSGLLGPVQIVKTN